MGTELGVTGIELEYGADFSNTEELWYLEKWVEVGRVCGVQGPGVSILLGGVVVEIEGKPLCQHQSTGIDIFLPSQQKCVTLRSS